MTKIFLSPSLPYLELPELTDNTWSRFTKPDTLEATVTLPSPSPQSPWTHNPVNGAASVPLHPFTSLHAHSHHPKLLTRSETEGSALEIIGFRPLTGLGRDALVSSFHSRPLNPLFTLLLEHVQNASPITSHEDQIPPPGSLPDCTHERPTSCHHLLFLQVFVGPLPALCWIMAPLGTLYPGLNREMHSETALVAVMIGKAFTAQPSARH